MENDEETTMENFLKLNHRWVNFFILMMVVSFFTIFIKMMSMYSLERRFELGTNNAEEQFAKDNGIDTSNFQELLYNGYIAEAKMFVTQANMNAGEADVESQIQTAIELIKKAHALKLKMDNDKE